MEKKKITDIFLENGVNYFRECEVKVISSLTIIRNHVIVVGGGALEKDESFHILKSIGLLIWVDTPPMAIAWRLVQNSSELKKRPLLSDLFSEGDRMRRYENLRIRLETLHSERSPRYKEASVVLRDSVSTPEICARNMISLVDRYLSAKKVQATDFED